MKEKTIQENNIIEGFSKFEHYKETLPLIMIAIDKIRILNRQLNTYSDYYRHCSSLWLEIRFQKYYSSSDLFEYMSYIIQNYDVTVEDRTLILS